MGVYYVRDGSLATDVFTFGRSRQRTNALAMCKHRSRRSIILPFSKVIFNTFQIIFAYLFRRVSIIW